MKTLRVVSAAVVAIAATLSLAGPANAAPNPSGESTRPASTDDKNLPQKYTKYIPLKLVPEDESDVSAAALPSGCGLWVTLSRSGNTLTGSLLTSCAGTYAVMRTWGNLQRSRWYGWQTMASNERKVDNRSSVAVDITYNCGGTGTHDFRVVGNGYIAAYSGSTYTASAYDQIDDVSC